MPGKPAYPVLAVCPNVSLEPQNTTACRNGHPAAAVPPPMQQDGVASAVTAGVGKRTSSSDVSGEGNALFWWWWWWFVLFPQGYTVMFIFLIVWVVRRAKNFDNCYQGIFKHEDECNVSDV